MKRILLVLAAMLGFAVFADPVAQVTKGEDVATFNDLREAIAQCADATCRLDLLCDVDMTGVNWVPVAFSGQFEGHGFAIKNLTINSTGDYVGFFSKLGEDRAHGSSLVKDLTFRNATIRGKEHVGVLAGKSFSSTVSNVTVCGTIEVEGTKYVGGLIGLAYARIYDCTVDGGDASVSSVAAPAIGGYEVGGLVGMLPENNNVAVNCSVKNLTVSAEKSACGGVVGRVISNSHVVGCSVENVVVVCERASEAAQTCGMIVGETVTSPANENYPPMMRYYFNNTATNTTATEDQLYGLSAADVAWKALIGTHVEGDFSGMSQNWTFTGGTFLAYGANPDLIPLEIPEGNVLTKTAQSDGGIVLALAPAAVPMANIYIDCDSTEAKVARVQRFDVAAVGDVVSFTVSPKFGYKLDSVTVNGSAVLPQDGVYSYTVLAADADQTVEGGAPGVTIKVLASADASSVLLTIPDVEGLGKPTVTYTDADGTTQKPEVVKNTETGDWETMVPDGVVVTITYENPAEGKQADPSETSVAVNDDDKDGKVVVPEDALPRAIDAEGLPVNITGFEPVEEGGATKFAITIANPLEGHSYYYRTATTLPGLKTAAQTKINEVPTAGVLLFKVPRNPSEPQRFYEVLVK